MMKSKPLLKVAVTTTREAEEAVYVVFEDTFETPPVVTAKPDSNTVEVAVFLPNVRACSEDRRLNLQRRLRRIRDTGLDPGSGRVRVRQIADRDWAESWKRHFRPLKIGGVLLVKPSWSRRRAALGQVEVVIDPGLGFGTGQHPTTAFCLEQIVAARGHSEKPSLLDLGAGSGILAVAAARLGYHPVRGLDNDRIAVRVARENARRNGVFSKARFLVEDLTRLPVRSAEKFDVVCANLLADLHLTHRKRIVNRVGPGGTLVLAGILAVEFEEVAAAYSELGFRTVCAKVDGEWQSFALSRATKD